MSKESAFNVFWNTEGRKIAYISHVPKRVMKIAFDAGFTAHSQIIQELVEAGV